MTQVTTAGFAFVEFVSSKPEDLVPLFERLGFKPVGQSERTGAVLLRQNEATLIVNPASNPFRDVHGASVRAIGINVDDARNAVAQALTGGAREVGPDEFGTFVVQSPAIAGIGDSLVYFVDGNVYAEFSMPYAASPDCPAHDASVQAIDHTSNIVRPENLDLWANFYKDTFAFTQKQYLDVKGKKTGMRARSMVSPCGKVSIPIAAAAHDQAGTLNQNDEFIRDYNGEGIQHIALLSSNIERTIAFLERGGIEFMDAPSDVYYGGVDSRVPGHGLDLDAIRERGILVDGKGGGKILLQRFTRRQIGPVFFEIIERRGEDGFGEGNFKALFESQEIDQVKRAAINAILERYQAWMQAIRARDLDSILDIYADDAVYMPPGKPAFSGKNALREIWASYLDREDFAAIYVPTIHLSESSDMAYDIGRYRISMKKDGHAVAFEGKYVVVWKLVGQRWKAVADIDNDNGPST